MAKATKKYPEIKNIKEDIGSIKDNAVELSRHLTKDGIEQTEELKARTAETFEDLKGASRDQIKRLEMHVRQKPAQSMAIAFAGGLLASFLLNRR